MELGDAECVFKTGDVQKKRRETWYPGPTWQDRKLALVRVSDVTTPRFLLVYCKRGKDKAIDSLELEGAMCQLGTKEASSFRVKPACQERIYTFRVEAQEEAKAWVQAIKDAVEGVLKPPSGPLPPPGAPPEAPPSVSSGASQRGTGSTMGAEGEEGKERAAHEVLATVGTQGSVSGSWSPAAGGVLMSSLGMKKRSQVKHAVKGIGKYRSGWVVLDTLDTAGELSSALYFFDKNKPSERAVGKKQLVMGQIFDAEPETGKKNTVGVRNHGEMALYLQFSHSALQATWLGWLRETMPSVAQVRATVEQYVGREARLASVPKGLALLEEYARCLAPVEFREPGAWAHSDWPLSVWAEHGHVLRVDWEGLTQYEHGTASQEGRVLWHVPLSGITTVYVYQHGRFDIQFEEEGHQMVLCCCAQDSAAAWRVADAVSASSSEAVSDMFEPVEEARALRLLCRQFVVWRAGGAAIDLEKFVHSFAIVFGFMGGTTSKQSWGELDELEREEEMRFLRKCASALEVRQAGHVVAKDAAGRRVAGWMLYMFSEVHERHLYVWDKKGDKKRRCDDSDGEDCSLLQDLPNPKWFCWLHDWEPDGNPALFSSKSFKQYGPAKCHKLKRRSDVQWSTKPVYQEGEARQRLFRVMGHRRMQTEDLHKSEDSGLLELWAELEQQRRPTDKLSGLADFISPGAGSQPAPRKEPLAARVARYNSSAAEHSPEARVVREASLGAPMSSGIPQAMVDDRSPAIGSHQAPPNVGMRCTPRGASVSPERVQEQQCCSACVLM